MRLSRHDYQPRIQESITIMIWRSVQKPFHMVRGLVIGWKIPNRQDLDGRLRAALPGWAIMVTDQAPLSVVSSDIQDARKAAGVSQDAPVILVGWGAGCQTVRSVIMSRILDPWGVAVFDGTHANSPPADWQIQVWEHLADRARAGLSAFIGTATCQTYMNTIPEGQPGRAWPASWVLARALGLPAGAQYLAQPVDVGGLYVASYASKDQDPAAHLAQILDVAPRLLARLATGPGAAAKVQTVYAALDPAAPWRNGALTLSQRLVLWAQAEVQRWKDQGLTESAGPNDSPRIREYFGLEYKRRITETILRVHGLAWCAVAACFGVSSCLLSEDPRGLTYRISGLELQQDAEANHAWGSNPVPGSLIIMRREGASWGRHVGIVISSDTDSVTFAAGNEGNTWAERTIKLADSSILGFIRIG